MNTDDFITQIHALNDLILRGSTLEAMQRFYADEVEMQENEDASKIGLELCLEHEKKNLDKVIRMKSQLLNQAIDYDNQIVMSEWQFIITDKKEQTFKLTEISVQKWRNGKVWQEKFYFQKYISI